VRLTVTQLAAIRRWSRLTWPGPWCWCPAQRESIRACLSDPEPASRSSHQTSSVSALAGQRPGGCPRLSGFG